MCTSFELPSFTGCIFTTCSSQSVYSWTVWFRNSLQTVMPQYVLYIQFCSSASMLCVESSLGVSYFLRSLRWLYTRNAGDMKQAFRCIVFVRSHFVAEMKRKRQNRFSVDEKFTVPLTSGFLCRHCLAFWAVGKWGSTWTCLPQQYLEIGAWHLKNVVTFSLIVTTFLDCTVYSSKI